MNDLTLQVLAWFAAFWTAVLAYRGRAPDPGLAPRFVIGLGIGAALARFGWAALHLPALLAQPALVLSPATGFTVLTLPIALLLVAPSRSRASARSSFLAASLGSLPLALAVARLGCLAAGCCHGTPTLLPWGVAIDAGALRVHPTPAYEIAGCVALWLVVRALPPIWIASVVLIGFGLIRLLVEPWRAEPPLGAPLVAPSLLAAAWMGVGVLLSPAVATRRTAAQA